MPLATILKQQCAWADAKRIVRRGHVCTSIEPNLFKPLSAAARAEFAAANGDELGLSGQTPKLSSLRSSSALACNVFDPWRNAPMRPLAAALGLDSDLLEFHFEQRLPHGLGSSPPNLDLVLFPMSGQPIGVESKFCEPYDAKENHPPIDAKYFAGHQGRWAAFGLTRCQALAANIGRTVTFRRLGAGQLLKHILGLARVFESRGPVRLLYLWFDIGCGHASEHRIEIQRFAQHVGDEIAFCALTYQDIHARLQVSHEPVSGYYDYLAARYFAA